MIKRTMLIAAGLCAAAVASAKPLYITVPRAYGSEESPLVDVAFAGTEPVELRVLRPKELGRYITEQANLRRAYREPTTILNPGRFLARGLNAIDDPAEILLTAMDPELRRQVAPALPKRSAVGEKLSRLQEGPERLVSVPDGMEVVRTEWLNLDLGGGERGFDVPGFTDWGGGGWRSGFQERRVALRPLPAGVYLLQLVQNRVEGQVTLVVSDLNVQVKQTDGELLVRVAGRDQRAKEGATVEVYGRGGKPQSATTDERGEARIKVTEPRLLLTIRAGNDTALVDTDFYSTLAVQPDVFIYSDRPIYKPGDALRFRGLVRKPASFLAQLFTPKKRGVNVRLVNREGADVSARAVIDEYGAFAGRLTVPATLETGVVQLVAEVDGDEHQSEARVQQYVKPTFYLELHSDQDSVSPGGTIDATVKARRYAGGVPAGARYEVYLYRSVLSTPSWVDDAGMGGEGSAVTYGSVSTSEGQLAVPVRLYSSAELRSGAEGFDYSDPWASAPQFDAKGEASITVQVPELTDEDKSSRIPFKYTLTVRAQDPEASTASTSRNFFFAECDVLGQLMTSARFALVGGPAQLAVRAVTLAGRPFGATDGVVQLVLRDHDGDERELAKQSFKTGADGVWRLPLPTDRLGTLIARVTLRDRSNREWAGETQMLVIGAKGERVVRVPILAAEALPTPLAPGETARVVALFPEGWGPGGKNGGPLWVTLSGAGIHDTALLEVEGTTLVHEVPIEQRFGSAVYVSLAHPTRSGRWEERTIAFRIIPRERTLTVRVEPEQAEAKPLGLQTVRLRVTDHAGRGVAAQLSLSVVDKAVYAIQEEFRPRVLDFFYPLLRNNVSNFYSAEFQGYGYGEYLARLRQRVRAHAFAAVKPPEVERKDEDTAFWRPDIVTDSTGLATVSFKLPANQTLWVATAVAADAAGRFGEGSAEFASRGGLFVAASLPQFLRAGDRATGTVRVANTKGKKARALSLSLETAGAAVVKLDEPSLTLAAGAEKILPFELAPTSAGPLTAALRFTSDGSPRLDRRGLTVVPAALPERVAQSRLGGGALALEVPGGATLRDVELRLMPTSVAVALGSVRELLNYPYGCLEQLVATTIPNLAVYRTLKEVGALGRLDPESQTLLEEASSRSMMGLSRILNLSVKGGGFTWFGGYAETHPALTLIAVDGLTYAVEAGLLPRDEPRLVAAAQYLAAQKELPAPLEATRTYVLARLEGKKHAAEARNLLDAASGAEMYGAALAVLAAEHAGIMGEPAVKAKVAQLADESAKNLARVTSYGFGDAFWRYPLGRVGLAAILTHAASFGRLDKAAARERFITVMAGGEELSTFERSTVLLHSLWLIGEDAKGLRELAPPKLSGAGQAALRPFGAGLRARLDDAVRTVEVGSFDGVATLSATRLTPLAEVQAKQEGMSLRRSYWLLRPDGREPLAAGAAIAPGSHVFVELELDAFDGEKYRTLRSAYYVLEDAVPAGFEPVIEDKRWQSPPFALPLRHEALKYRSLNPDRATFFFDEPAWWSRSPRRIGYVMRAQFPGTFAAPPARLQDMYAPGVFAQTAAASLTIAGR